MPVYISSRLVNQVTDALRQANTPLSTNDVANIIGKSKQATRLALNESNAKKVDDSWPILWTLGDTDTPSVPSQFSDVKLLVAAKHVQNILPMWNDNHAQLGDAIKALRIDEDSIPAFVAEQLGTIAGSIAYLAHTLDKVANKPDWYEILTETE